MILSSKYPSLKNFLISQTIEKLKIIIFSTNFKQFILAFLSNQTVFQKIWMNEVEKENNSNKTIKGRKCNIFLKYFILSFTRNKIFFLLKVILCFGEFTSKNKLWKRKNLTNNTSVTKAEKFLKFWKTFIEKNKTFMVK